MRHGKTYPVIVRVDRDFSDPARARTAHSGVLFEEPIRQPLSSGEYSNNANRPRETRKLNRSPNRVAGVIDCFATQTAFSAKSWVYARGYP